MTHEQDDGPWPAEHDPLLADLGEALGSDHAPPGLVARAEGLVAFMDVDRELLELLDEAAAEPVGSRGAADTDRLVFELADGTVSLELTVGPDQLAGQVLGGAVVGVALDGRSGELARSGVDALGRFSLPLSREPVRLRLDVGSARPLATDWFLP